jgi:hypothetical protein
MTYHGACRLTGKISKVIMECRSEISKGRNERARGAHERRSGQKKEGC